MTIPGRRPERLGERIREEISALLVSELKDPRIGFATVTAVRVTPDLRLARVYVSVLGTAAEQQAALAGFRSAAAFIRHALAKTLTIRRMPDLAFELDLTEDRAARIEQLLKDAHTPSEEKK
jgi:ribosome-binding factor A